MEHQIPAVRIFDLPNGDSAFEYGFLPTNTKFDITTFWGMKIFEDWQHGVHPAPRRQYVITLKGKIHFHVTDGTGFILEPGIILLVEDVNGKGHSWEFATQDKEWIRLYVPLETNGHTFFTPTSD